MKKIIKFLAWSIGIVVLMIVLLFASMEFMIWKAYDYAPHYAQIDACLDSGKIWDYQKELCSP